MDVGTDLTDEQLAALPKGRHMLAIIGTHGVNGYTPASAPVAGDAVTDEMTQAGAKAAREYFDQTGGNDPAVIYRAMRAAPPAAPQAGAENDWKAAIRKFMDTAIPALAAIANVHTPDEIDALEAMPREPVIDQVRRLSQACEELRRQVRPERPKADKDAARCTCPSGDGSLRHPCPAHPQGKPPAPGQPTDKEQA